MKATICDLCKEQTKRVFITPYEMVDDVRRVTYQVSFNVHKYIENMHDNCGIGTEKELDVCKTCLLKMLERT